MNAKMIFTPDICKLAIVLVFVATIGLSSQPAWAQPDSERGRPRGSRSAIKFDDYEKPPANRNCKTPQFGSTLGAPPVRTQANSNERFRRRGAIKQNDLSPSAHGGTGNSDSWPTFPSAAMSAGNQQRSRVNNPDLQTPGGSANPADRSDAPHGWRTNRNGRIPSSANFNSETVGMARTEEVGKDKIKWEPSELDAAANESGRRLRADYCGDGIVDSEGWDEIPEDIMFPRVLQKGRLPRARGGDNTTPEDSLKAAPKTGSLAAPVGVMHYPQNTGTPDNVWRGSPKDGDADLYVSNGVQTGKDMERAPGVGSEAITGIGVGGGPHLQSSKSDRNQPRSLTGQDQETGEMITWGQFSPGAGHSASNAPEWITNTHGHNDGLFGSVDDDPDLVNSYGLRGRKDMERSRSLWGQSRFGQPQSFVDSEGWDEVPEGILFAAGQKKQGPNLNIGSGQSPGVARPGDTTAGSATGK